MQLFSSLPVVLQVCTNTIVCQAQVQVLQLDAQWCHEHVVRMYRGDDNAPSGPDQDKVPAAELQPGRGRAVHRGEGLRQEDVRPGDQSPRMVILVSYLVFRKDYSRSGRDCFPQSLWRHQRELGNSLHLNNFKKCFCLDQTNLVLL